jgi:hypothetical protein
MTGKERTRKRNNPPRRHCVGTHFPVIAGGHPRDHAQMLSLHPLMLRDLGDTAGLALHGGATTDGFGVFVETVERTVHTARWGDRGGLLRTFGGPESRGDIHRALERTQLA